MRKRSASKHGTFSFDVTRLEILALLFTLTALVTFSVWQLEKHDHSFREMYVDNALGSMKSSWTRFPFPDQSVTFDTMSLWSHPRGILHSNKSVNNVTFGKALYKNIRTPLVIIQLRLPKEVFTQILSLEVFSCNQSVLDKLPNLDKRVKPPVYIYEGYFHSLQSSLEIYSRNPNPSIAIDFMKPAASPLLRAFYVAFRKVNWDIFDSLKRALYTHSSNHILSNATCDVCYMLASWIEQEKIFGDLSIQIHYGRGNDDNFKNAWHADAENSLLHLAVTLRGSRVLHSKRCLIDHGPAQEFLLPQHPQDVYLSSSALMLHAPKFSNTNYEERVIAVHARILYTTSELRSFRKCKTEESWISLTNILARHLERAEFQVPSFLQIQESLSYLL